MPPSGARARIAGRSPLRHRAIAAALLVPLLGCSSVHAWSAPRPLVPAGGGAPAAGSGRGLGVLHRLLLPTPTCDIERDFRRAPDEEAACVRELEERAFARLRDERGYDVLLPALLGSAGGAPAGAAARLAAALPVLERFALAAPDGAQPDPELAARVRALCAEWEADGIALVRVQERVPGALALGFVVATLVFGWPLVAAAQYAETRIDVFEAASGELVWRRRERLRPAPSSLAEALQGSFDAIDAPAPRAGAE